MILIVIFGVIGAVLGGWVGAVVGIVVGLVVMKLADHETQVQARERLEQQIKSHRAQRREQP